MPKIIITRHCHGGLTAIVGNGDDINDQNPPIMEFDEYADAVEVAEDNPLCQAFGYEIVDVGL